MIEYEFNLVMFIGKLVVYVVSNQVNFKKLITNKNLMHLICQKCSTKRDGYQNDKN